MFEVFRISGDQWFCWRCCSSFLCNTAAPTHPNQDQRTEKHSIFHLQTCHQALDIRQTANIDLRRKENVSKMNIVVLFAENDPNR